MDDAELELFESSLRRATDGHSGAALDEALDEIGWQDALEDDMAAAISILFERQGAANASSSALDDLLAAVIGQDVPPECAVVLPSLDSWAPPGARVDGTITLVGLGTARLRTAEVALVATGTAADGPDGAVVVPTSALTVRKVGGMDPSLGLVEVTGTDVDGPSWQSLSPETWPEAVGVARIALGHELVGAASAMLELACTHARERVQFDRPIAEFQAVRHRLAETLVAVEAARALLTSAWEDPSPGRRSMAKAVAGRSARTAARHCQQVLAGMGFTTEHPFHLYLRRVLVLDELFGSAASLTRVLGTDVIAGRLLPAALPL